MNINITNIRITSISNIGSLNIGKTIIAKNNAAFTLERQISSSPSGKLQAPPPPPAEITEKKSEGKISPQQS